MLYHPDKRVTASKVLSAALSPSNQQFRFILLDCIWRFLWLLISVGATLILGAAVLSQIRSMNWEGPDLGVSSPMILLAALRQFWNSYGAFLIVASGLLLLMLVILWIGLEALFRGGFKRLWLYAGTGAARTALLLGTAGIFLMLSAGDEGAGILLIGVVVVLEMWVLVGVVETLVRRDAVDLLATSLLPLSAVLGCLRLAEGVLAFVLLGSAAVALRQSEEKALAILFAVFVVMFWMIVHSYLVAARYSAIDIMRRNVVRP
jgi:hypothetical protein